MAGRPSKIRYLDVWMNGEQVGCWRYSSRTGHEFQYEASWLNSPMCRPLSLSLPVSNGTRTFTGERVEYYFDNLLPDSADIRNRISTKYGTSASSAFDLLAQIGRDCVGAVQLLPYGSAQPDVRRIDASPLSSEAIEKLLDAAVSGAGVGLPEEDDLRISIAGAQEKTALLWHQGAWHLPHGATPTTHILKLPLGEVGCMRADFSTSVENEWLCSKIVQAYGLPIADCRIEMFGRHKALVVTRFDRRMMGTWWARLPQEDFCQATGAPSARKYEEHGGPGIESILGLLRGSENAAIDRENFLSAQLLFWLLAAPDGHAKNFSIFLDAHGRFRMTPIYDVMSAWPVIGNGARQFQWQKVKMAMAIRSKNAHYRMSEIQRRHWNTVAKKNAMGSDFEHVIQRFIDATPKVIEDVAALLPSGFPEAVSGPIFKGIAQQVNRLSQGIAS